MQPLIQHPILAHKFQIVDTLDHLAKRMNIAPTERCLPLRVMNSYCNCNHRHGSINLARNIPSVTRFEREAERYRASFREQFLAPRGRAPGTL